MQQTASSRLPASTCVCKSTCTCNQTRIFKQKPEQAPCPQILLWFPVELQPAPSLPLFSPVFPLPHFCPWKLGFLRASTTLLCMLLCDLLSFWMPWALGPACPPAEAADRESERRTWLMTSYSQSLVQHLVSLPCQDSEFWKSSQG